MIPLDPEKMAKLMKQMGIKTKDIEAEKVVICTEGEKIIIENPKVTQMEMKGQSTFTIMGKVKREVNIPEEDIELVASKCGVEKEEAREALEKCNGDIAEAIMRIKEKNE